MKECQERMKEEEKRPHQLFFRKPLKPLFVTPTHKHTLILTTGYQSPKPRTDICKQSPAASSSSLSMRKRRGKGKGKGKIAKQRFHTIFLPSVSQSKLNPNQKHRERREGGMAGGRACELLWKTRLGWSKRATNCQKKKKHGKAQRKTQEPPFFCHVFPFITMPGSLMCRCRVFVRLIQPLWLNLSPPL